MFSKIIGPQRAVSWAFQFWPILVISFVCAFMATWLCKRIAIKFKIVDKPDNLVKTHKEPVAYLGGIGILVGLTVGIMTGVYLTMGWENSRAISRWLFGILIGGGIACFIGVVDDIFEIKPWQKIMGQLTAACLIVLAGIRPSLYHFTKPLGIEMPQQMEFLLEISIIFIFVLGATNSLNLLDGLDGLCAGVTAIITICMLLLTVHLATWGFSDVGDPVRIIICLGLIGGVFGFLPFNRHPAKIFMGDAGSMLLGFVMASLMMLFAEQIPRWWMASIVVFGLPILDTATALARRLINKKPVFVSDRGHIYDQMMDRRIPLKKTVMICYFLAGLYGFLGLIISQIRTRYALIVYVFVVVISALIIWKKGFLKMEGLRGAIQKEDSHSTQD